ncbi:MAG: hypothetical protein WDZ35_10080 [Crocinitomicaceae bacterium]
MNKIVNAFSIIVLSVFTLMAMTIIFDLSISSIHLKAMPFKLEILSGLAILFFLINLIRIRRRWQGVKDMSKFQRFNFSTSLSKTFLTRCKMFTTLEIIFMLGALAVFLRLALLDYKLMLFMIAVLLVLILESVLFLTRLLKKGKPFRIGINDKVIAYFGREMHLFFYTGLLRVELYQSDLISFKYREDLQLFIPVSVLEPQDRIPFRDALIEQLNKKNIYFDDALRNWK